MKIRTLRPEDVPAALALSTQAGWNQLEADWTRLLDLAPELCFAGVVDGELVATSTLVSYDEVGWVGMVLVDESHRRQGYGMEIFRQALDAAIEVGLEVVGLDATDAGRAVYQNVQFVDVAPITRWQGELTVPPATASSAFDGTPPVVRDPPVARLRELDEQACGVDRGDLLSRLLSEEGTVAFQAADDRGYAIVRPGRTHWQVGPVIARDGQTLEALLEAVADSLPDRRVIVDVLGESGYATELGRFGLTEHRHLTRMTHQASNPALMGDAVVAAAGFELG
ncbi:GNAT family N-acetyltransferase [Haloarchaeobius sp. HME9146]|uniref:GNAT family N-acetyltransferase n=1 Tax=Haloarchaeobius sp. HME9146 TaxID=2978732 RepID=UPI0021BDF0BB|nr:GNAT family N-acetyltransferase [Haloarchaeobius sp. HME9146]MCT9098048.1 GNAT family N-acetyltransferase [Haloarchaeobius sp. HME9146]